MKLKELSALGQDLGLDEASLKEWLQTQPGNAEDDLEFVQEWQSELLKRKWESQEQVDKLLDYRKAEAEFGRLEQMLLRATNREKISLKMSRGKTPQGLSTKDVDE